MKWNKIEKNPKSFIKKVKHWYLIQVISRPIGESPERIPLDNLFVDPIQKERGAGDMDARHKRLKTEEK